MLVTNCHGNTAVEHYNAQKFILGILSLRKDTSYLVCTKTGVAMYSHSGTLLSLSCPVLELCDPDEDSKDGSEMPCFNKSTYMINITDGTNRHNSFSNDCIINIIRNNYTGIEHNMKHLQISPQKKTKTKALTVDIKCHKLSS